MSGTGAAVNRHAGFVRGWLWCVALAIVLTLIVGGATRLTESGLSIVEWRPVTGVLPPMTDAAWQAEFEKYQAIPQYQQLNRGMSLAAFKTIFWWEWSHRLLARSVGAIFLLPFLFFLVRGWIEPWLKLRLWLIFLAGGALGAVGWWMVSSGLADRTSVSQYRLAFHLTLACAIYVAVVWTARQVGARTAIDAARSVKLGALALAGLALFQIYLGALVAGLRAGLAYNTWPLIDGALVPQLDRLFVDHPLWRNFFENVLTVQFDHRMVAYALVIGAFLHAANVMRAGADRATIRWAAVLAGVTLMQGVLGVVTLLLVVPLHMALTHQAFAILVLTVAALHAGRLNSRPAAR